MTGRISVTFRKPVPVGEELHVVGEIVRNRGRVIETHGIVSRASGGTVLAEANATFLKMTEGRRRDLERRYATSSDAFARVHAAVAAEERRRLEHPKT